MRLRSPATLIAILAFVVGAFFWIPDPHGTATSLSWELPDGRVQAPLYTAEYVGLAISILSGIFLAMGGFYLVAGSVRRDRERNVGAILAATPLSKTAYLGGKFAAHFVYLLVLATLGLAAGLVAFLRFGTGPFSLAGFTLPYFASIIPAVAVVASLAVLFDVTPILRGRGGLVLWFFFFIFVLIKLPVDLSGADIEAGGRTAPPGSPADAPGRRRSEDPAHLRSFRPRDAPVAGETVAPREGQGRLDGLRLPQQALRARALARGAAHGGAGRNPRAQPSYGARPAGPRGPHLRPLRPGEVPPPPKEGEAGRERPTRSKSSSLNATAAPGGSGPGPSLPVRRRRDLRRGAPHLRERDLDQVAARALGDPRRPAAGKPSGGDLPRAARAGDLRGRGARGDGGHARSRVLAARRAGLARALEDRGAVARRGDARCADGDPRLRRVARRRAWPRSSVSSRSRRSAWASARSPPAASSSRASTSRPGTPRCQAEPRWTSRARSGRRRSRCSPWLTWAEASSSSLWPRRASGCAPRGSRPVSFRAGPVQRRTRRPSVLDNMSGLTYCP